MGNTQLKTEQAKKVKKMADRNKKFVRYPEGAELYSIGLTKFQSLGSNLLW